MWAPAWKRPKAFDLFHAQQESGAHGSVHADVAAMKGPNTKAKSDLREDNREYLFEELWANAEVVDSENAPSFMMDITNAPVEITLEASQTDKRFMNKGGRRPQCPLLLRFYQCSYDVTQHSGGEIHLVHSSAWGHCRDAMTAVRVNKNGKFLAMVSIPHGRAGCQRMIFRTYSNKKISLVPIVKHRQFVAVAPGFPLNAMPYTMVGFARLDTMTERLPQMFDAEDGKGKPLAGQRFGPLQKRSNISDRDTKGFKKVGRFGGTNAHATVDEAEEQPASCSVM